MEPCFCEESLIGVLKVADERY